MTEQARRSALAPFLNLGLIPTTQQSCRPVRTAIAVAKDKHLILQEERNGFVKRLSIYKGARSALVGIFSRFKTGERFAEISNFLLNGTDLYGAPYSDIGIARRCNRQTIHKQPPCPQQEDRNKSAGIWTARTPKLVASDLSTSLCTAGTPSNQERFRFTWKY